MVTSIAEQDVSKRLTDQDWRVSNTTTTSPDGAILTKAPPGRRIFRFSFDGGEFVFELVGDLPAWVEPTVRSLGKLLQLSPDWDTYGGSPVNPKCIAAALELALCTLQDDTPVPSVVPTSRGGLQFEWHTGGVDLEIEFLSATRVCGLFEDPITGTSWEKDLSYDLRHVIDAISTLSQRQ